MGQQQNGRPPLVRTEGAITSRTRLTGYALRAVFKWTGLVFAWMIVGAILTAGHVGGLSLFTTAPLIWYAVHCARRSRGPQPVEPAYDHVVLPDSSWRFNPPPTWPAPENTITSEDSSYISGCCCSTRGR
jgi:hypothetical protein